MFGSDILEVAISMAFLFLFMSTIASALREAFEAWKQHRAADLEKGIAEMLRTEQPEEWVRSFYNHPMISSLYKGQYEKNGKLMPAYIPKENFSLALLDLAAEASQAGKLLSMKDLSDKLTAIEHPNAVQRIVLTALTAGNHELDEVRKRLEDWYDGSMDRVSSWYAKRTGKFLFAIGLVSAVLLNVDSITVVKRLIVDRPLRQTIVAEAESYAQRNARNQPIAAGQSANGAAVQAPPPDAGAAQADTTASAQKKSFEELRSEFNGLGFPTGWTWSGRWPYPAPQACAPDGAGGYRCPSDWGSYAAALIVALLGWLITAVAIMLGAPFWFDILNKLISLRSSLKPPEDKPAHKKTPKAPVNQGGGAG